MIEPPALTHEALIAVLLQEWRLDACQLAFLPLGADLNSAVYRVVAPEDAVYFLKVRAGQFDEILAPRERDLMAAGSGLMGGWRTADEEERLFYSGYGDVLVDPAALMYYRCERIVADIAVYCQQLLLTDEGGEDRPQALRYLMSNFAPGGTIELATGTDRSGD